MPARSIIPEILAKLEPYLELLDRQWESQGEGCRTPTLPHDKGQVNVRAITKALGLRQSQEQHFFKKRELALAINELARSKGCEESIAGSYRTLRTGFRPSGFTRSSNTTPIFPAHWPSARL